MAIEIRETTITTDDAGTTVRLHISDAPLDAEHASFRLDLLAKLPRYNFPLVMHVQREAILQAQSALESLADALVQNLPPQVYMLTEKVLGISIMARAVLSEPHFHIEEAAFAYVEARLWPKGPVCHHCGERSAWASWGKITRSGLHKCYHCRKPFTVRMGTLFGVVPSAAAPVAANHPPDVRQQEGHFDRQIQRMLRCSMKTAWFLGTVSAPPWMKSRACSIRRLAATGRRRGR